jgi:hypothetical protein
MTHGHIADLRQLRTHHRPESRPPWHAVLMQQPLNGGKVSIAEIDALAEQPQATALTISGLEDKTLAHLVRRFGSQFTAVHFWKCPRVADLSPLEDMPGLKHVAFYWNQRATRLWNFARTPVLHGLHFDDFAKLGRLDDLAAATSLDTLVFGNAVWNKFAIDTLEPLAALGTTLRHLAFNAKAIADGRIQPLARLTALTTLDFPSHLFATEQIAWLRAWAPAALDSTALEPFRRLDTPLMRRGKPLDVLVAGKGKPFLSSQADAAKLARFVDSFQRARERFAADPILAPTLS